MKKIIKTILGLILSMSLALLIVWFWIPPWIAKGPIREFEKACTDNNIQAIRANILPTSPFLKIFNKHNNQFIEEYNKFKPGFEIKETSWTFMRNDINEGSIIIINAYIIKEAKIDNRGREFDKVSIAYDNGRWKIERYYFPDFIDY
ncbi:MAG TPA: hypothetical protein VGK27_08355 [Candidatus Deferrimicrobiaceae bacterium]|jgi:hypothetical protein